MPKILVVEDNAETRDIITILLELKGYDVFVAKDGYEGVVMAAGELPDLIIADLNLPVLHGVEMIKILRARHEYRDTPILAITALGEEHTQSAINAGADHAMSKPVEPDMFLAFIKHLLNRNRSNGSAAAG